MQWRHVVHIGVQKESPDHYDFQLPPPPAHRRQSKGICISPGCNIQKNPINEYIITDKTYF